MMGSVLTFLVLSFPVRLEGYAMVGPVMSDFKDGAISFSQTVRELGAGVHVAYLGGYLLRKTDPLLSRSPIQGWGLKLGPFYAYSFWGSPSQDRVFERYRALVDLSGLRIGVSLFSKKGMENEKLLALWGELDFILDNTFDLVVGVSEVKFWNSDLEVSPRIVLGVRAYFPKR